MTLPRLTSGDHLSRVISGDIVFRLFQIFFLRANDSAELEQLDNALGTARSHSLLYLDMFTEYTVQILGYNTAGDGPRSRPVTARTLTVRTLENARTLMVGTGKQGVDTWNREGEAHPAPSLGIWGNNWRRESDILL